MCYLKIGIKKFSFFTFSFLFFFLAACSSVTSFDQSKAAEANVKLGLAYLEAGQSDLAKNKLQLAVKQDPHSGIAYDALAYFFEQTGAFKRAEELYLKAISVAKIKDKGASYNNYGTFLYRQDKYIEAIKYFLKAIHEPEYLHVGAVYENASLAAGALGNDQLADFYHQKALENKLIPVLK